MAADMPLITAQYKTRSI